MYTDKKNILQLAALLKAHGVTRIVLCPGSRNIPLTQLFMNEPTFQCFSMTDERNAAFFALGLALHGGKPAAVCCTSGTALLNMHPAMAEAYYQKVPLVVISADRPAAWIGQLDGQTLPQPQVFGKLSKCSVTLPEIHTEEEEWYANRLINEALMQLTRQGKGPVHINVPISEPLFDFSTAELPKTVRVMKCYEGLNAYNQPYEELIDRLNGYTKRMMLVGQMNLIYLFEKSTSKLLYKQFVWLSEHLANRTIPGWSIQNFDLLLGQMSEEEKETFRPELVITYGGHVVSKRMKNYLRTFSPKEHWHVSSNGEVADTFRCLTTVIQMDPFEFLEKIAYQLDKRTPAYPREWEKYAKQIDVPHFKYSSMGAIERLLAVLPQPSVLHLGNSSAVRFAQLFPFDEAIEVCCNRGTSGIEGSLTTALGYALYSDKLNFIILGDLSFFYAMNALWDCHLGKNVRILILNNGEGEIFRFLPGMPTEDKAMKAISGSHEANIAGWVKDRQLTYLGVHNDEELAEALPPFIQAEAEGAMVMEVFTSAREDALLYRKWQAFLQPR